MPRYLQEKSKGQKLNRIARFKLGNEWKASRYWMEEEKSLVDYAIQKERQQCA